MLKGDNNQLGSLHRLRRLRVLWIFKSRGSCAWTAPICSAVLADISQQNQQMKLWESFPVVSYLKRSTTDDCSRKHLLLVLLHSFSQFSNMRLLSLYDLNTLPTFAKTIELKNGFLSREMKTEDTGTDPRASDVFQKQVWLLANKIVAWQSLCCNDLERQCSSRMWIQRSLQFLDLMMGPSLHQYFTNGLTTSRC